VLLALAIVGFALAAAVGDLLRVPFPYVPPAARLLPAIAAGAFLGSRWGAASQALFAAAWVGAAALAALPGATPPAGGWPGVLPTDLGYPLGLPACAAVVGRLAGPGRKPSRRRLLVAGLLGLLVVDLVGLLGLAWLLPPRLPQPIGIGGLLRVGVLFPLPLDLAQVLVAAIALPRLRRRAPWLAFPYASL
jgi:biotin transport system substrate-specific component